jgi:hypothetical protein
MLINKYVPNFQFSEVHKTIVDGRANETYNSTLELDLSKSKVIEFLFRLRGLPFHHKKLSEVNGNMKFTLLEEIPYSEFLYGFWFSTKTEWVRDLNEFKQDSPKYNAKSAWSFSFNERSDGTTEIITETRVLCMNRKSKLIFSIYWFFIRPFSGLIRIEMLRLIKNKLKTKQ